MADLFPKPRPALQNAPSSGGAENLPSPPTLSLPKGGGALRGIDEKFSVNAATGTCSFSIPLALSPGRSGFSPPLSLRYDSGAGNGPFGLGWGLSLSSITRKTDKGLPLYRDDGEADTFLISGAEDLVVSLKRQGHQWVEDTRRVTEGPDTFTVRAYRPRLEGLFARVERWTQVGTGEAHWRSVAKDNVSAFYGRRPQSRIADPKDPRRIFQWLLEEMRDDKGNIIRFSYKQENGEGVDPGAVWEKNRRDPGGFAQQYLKRVEYANHVPFQAGDWHFELVFDYGEHDDQNPTPQEGRAWAIRSDSFSSHRSGFELRTHRLCRRALMFHRFPELGPSPCLVKSTNFLYRESPLVTYLTTVESAGYRRRPGGYDRESLPPLSLAYSEPLLHENVQWMDPASLENLPQGVEGSLYQWADLDGEGVPGMLTQQGGGWFYKRNLGGGRLAPVQSVGPRPHPGELRGGDQQLLDIDGDGRPALVQMGGPLAGSFERNDRGQWEGFVPFSSSPMVSWEDPNLRFIDLNGDGRSDVLIAGDHVFRWHNSLGRKGFGPEESVRIPWDDEAGPALVFEDATQSIFLADMTGDGLTDLARIRNGEICYWPNLGHGRFGAKVTMGRPPLFDDPDQFDPKRIRLADVDGTGVADLVYLSRQGVTLWFNESGNGWSAPRRLAGFPPLDALRTVTVTDLLGTGTGCLVWSSPVTEDAPRALRYIDLMGGQKPHLLISVKNNCGKETRLQYASSTKFYLADRARGTPWVTKLPFPVHVVEQVETQDFITGVKGIQRYRYHHGAYDGKEREFRGFGRVDQEDAESFLDYMKGGPAPVASEKFQPPTLTKTWFHTGLYVEGNDISAHFAEEYYSGDPQAWLLPDTVLPTGLAPEEHREAVRALKGGILRQELYALDGTPESVHPYSVAEGNFSVRLVQPGEGRRSGVFLTHPRETLRLHYERDPDDPRINHEMTLAVDDFGNVTRSAAVVYPRRVAAFPEQGAVLATVSEAEFINKPHEDVWYRVGLSCETRTYELAGMAAPANAPFSMDALESAFQNAVEVPYEDGTPPPPGQMKRRLIERVRTVFSKNDQTGPLPLGELESLALPYRTFKMVFTPGLLTAVYGHHLTGPDLENQLRQEGKYVLWDGAWWVPSGRQTYSAAQFYLPVRFMDPFIEPHHLAYVTEYDPYALMVEKTRDPLNNEMTALNNYRVLAPWLVTDVNQNRSGVRFDLLGLVTCSAVMGKAGAHEGDALDTASSEPLPTDDPTTRVVYEHFNWMNLGTPNRAHSLSRERHGAANPRWQEVYTYSDGSGREVMRKIQAEPGQAPGRQANGPLKRDGQGRPLFELVANRWVGTGRTVYNNKGMAVKQYEPFFDSSPDYTVERELVEWGFSPVLTYDPLNRLVRVDQPDGRFSVQRFDAWVQESWDENDTVLDSSWFAERLVLPAGSPERRAAQEAARHARTPSVAHLDTLGRVFLTEAHNGFDGAGLPLLFRSRADLDIEGNRRRLTNALNHTLLEFSYDMVGRALFQASADTGPRWTFPDMVGKSILGWDGPLNGPTTYRTRNTYDTLQRPEKFFVKRGGGGERLAEWTIYGETLANASDQNLRGKVYQVFDGAGRSTHDRYDFKGNLVQAQRQVLADYHVTPDWNNPPALDPEVFSSLTEYDALNRPIQLTNQHDGSVIEPAYNEANLLEKMGVRVRGGAAQSVIKNIDYDAKGQRTRILYGSDVETSYTYDPKTFRLSSLFTAPPAGPSPLQDLRYTYDPVGNVAEIEDRAQPDIFFANAHLPPSHTFVYDALYRLRRAEGREHRGVAVHPQPEYDWNDAYRTSLPHPNDVQNLRAYTETYSYDGVGNLSQIEHQADQGNWVRRYEYVPGSNRLQSTSLPNDPPGPLAVRITYDPRGNISRMPHVHSMTWDVEDQLQSVDRQGGGRAYYAYDVTGRRVRKVVVKNNGTLVEERIYVGNYEIYRRKDHDVLTLERQTLHVMDDQKRIALVETQTVDPGGPLAHPVPLLRYSLGNHLGSTALELDENGAILSYEEYYPYGGTAYQGGTAVAQTSLKRYRYIGKERDEETGFYYCRARYYAPWLGRWVSPDPAGIDGGQNVYEYAAGNPLAYKDDTGTAPGLTPLEAASVAEESGKSALVSKYAKVADVVDVTPVKNVSANGVDAHLVVGKGPAAVNVIGDVKHANAPSATGGSQIYSGKEVAGEISAFENAAKQDYRQLVRNLRSARASGTLDPATAYHAIEGAKAGEVLHEVVPSGYNTGVEKTIVGKYQASVTPNDTFADAAAHRQGLEVKAATKGMPKGKQANPETVFKRIQKSSAAARKTAAPAKGGAGAAKSVAPAEAAPTVVQTKAAPVETPVAAPATKAATAPKPVAAATASGGSKFLNGAKTVAGGTLAVAGSAVGGWQVGSGINAVIEGRTGEGAVDIVEGGSNLAMNIGGAYAVKTGAIVVGGGSAMATAAGVAAGASVALAAETVRAAMKGEPTPVDVADKFYGTHFGDIAGWVRGDYAGQ